MEYIEIAYQIIILIIGGAVLIVGFWGIIRGWHKTLKKFADLANKTALFIEEMLPDILDHLCATKRVPKNSMIKWLKLMSSGNVQSKSPLQITKNGYNLMKKTGLSIIFDNNKEKWAETIFTSELSKKLSKHKIENVCISYVIDLYRANDPIFENLENYFYENPNKLMSTDVYALLGISLRDYVFEKYPDLVK